MRATCEPVHPVEDSAAAGVNSKVDPGEQVNRPETANSKVDRGQSLPDARRPHRTLSEKICQIKNGGSRCAERHDTHWRESTFRGLDKRRVTQGEFEDIYKMVQGLLQIHKRLFEERQVMGVLGQVMEL